ncbi:Putative ribonuclease H protein [Dendrobium catenatum]|uniref:Ribonuclease H protein n=1 Tax=Dendrobium catenatum TaxID=906689 RepID=A0A2I0W523_9ASPA|nr:Putative ribonuclease H protein [Dendrobium catenatum]
MHYVCWKDLCLPRDHGRLGFHDQIMWRGALRARLAWATLNDSNSLLHRVMQAKYGLDMWNNSRIPKFSTAWKIIREGAEALSTVIRWRVGNGRGIHILNDCWILDRKLARWPTFVNIEEVENAMVSDLLDGNQNWVAARVERFFGKIMAARILDIDTVSSEGPDLPELSRACFGSSLSSIIYREKFVPSEYQFGWLLKLKLHPREKFHWFRLLQNAIPTNAWLSRRGLMANCDCPWGCNVEETVDHYTTRCSKLLEVFGILGKWGFLVPTFSSLGDVLEMMPVLADTNPLLAIIFCYSVYQVWRARNDLKHTGHHRPASIMAATVLSLLPKLTRKPILLQWGIHQPSRLPTLQSWDPFQAELSAAAAIREVLQGWMLDMEGIIVEGDCANAIKWLQQLNDRNFKGHFNFTGPDLDFFLDFKQVIFQHIPPECNKPADFCANLATFGNFVYSDVNVMGFPLSLLQLLRADNFST